MRIGTQISERFGVDDAWPVVCEPFTQWALEDNFSSGRPPLEDVGVQVVPDVVPYELMKLRLLNASHQALCYFGYLAGYRLVHEVAQDPLFANFLLDYMNREATPTLAPVPGIDLDAYKLQLIERFSNAAVRDTVARLCAESSDRIPKWLLPVIRENLAADRDVTLSASVVASWARYAEGIDEQGEPIKVVDRLADTLQRIAAQQREDPLAFVKNRELFGDLASRAGVHRAIPQRTRLLAQPRRPRHARGPRQAFFARLNASSVEPRGAQLRTLACWVRGQRGANSLRTTPIRSEVKTPSSATTAIDNSTKPKVKARLPLECSAAKTVPATPTKMPAHRAS